MWIKHEIWINEEVIHLQMLISKYDYARMRLVEFFVHHVLHTGEKDMSTERREHFKYMKNKYLTKLLCMTLMTGMALSGPASVLAAADADAEVVSSDEFDSSGDEFTDGGDSETGCPNAGTGTCNSDPGTRNADARTGYSNANPGSRILQRQPRFRILRRQNRIPQRRRQFRIPRLQLRNL